MDGPNHELSCLYPGATLLPLFCARRFVSFGAVRRVGRATALSTRHGVRTFLILCSKCQNLKSNLLAGDIN